VQESLFESQLRKTVATLAASLTQQTGVRIVNEQSLSELSPLSERMDLKSDLATGFPYSIRHASALGEMAADLIHSPQPKKGLITDLDDTLWGGILGEVGMEGISWHLESKTQMHGIYQQVLASLADAGILIGVASKNDPGLVKRAFERTELRLGPNDVFPFEVHWSRKSESVGRILKTWNVAADAVVFIDDSPMEVAEVKDAFPEMECIIFPKGDPNGVWEMLKHLRKVFGKAYLTEDDSIRLKTLRSSDAWRDVVSTSPNSSDDFLKAAEANIVFDCARQPEDLRAFELVNKTNQFNLNGRRFSESEWKRFFDDPDAFLLIVTYEDKYGFLGKIAVVMGKSSGPNVRVTQWVMSCRAFSRRIEHQCLKYLFEKFNARDIDFDFSPTPRNGPLQDFFRDLLGNAPAEGLCISKESFLKNAPPLFHQVGGRIHV